MKMKIVFYYIVIGTVLSLILYFLNDSYIDKQNKIKIFALFSLVYPIMIIIRIFLFFKKR
jgi:hypothetical protein